jgi:hypothetical protein
MIKYTNGLAAQLACMKLLAQGELPTGQFVFVVARLFHPMDNAVRNSQWLLVPLAAAAAVWWGICFGQLAVTAEAHRQHSSREQG